MNYLKKYYPIIVSLISAVIYYLTLAPSVVQIDCGELAAVQITLGIAHPTGYPLFTIVGYLFSLIPLFSSKIFQMNFLAMLFVSIGVGIFSYSVKLILNNIDKFSKIQNYNTKKKNQKTQLQIFELNEIQKIIISIIAGLILAFSKTFWLQSTSVEVYSFQILLFSLIISSLLNAYVSNDNDDKKSWIIFSIALGFGFSNHMTTLLLIPASAYLFFIKNKFDKNSFKKILIMFSIFLLVLIINYSYLPIRASQNPILNWGNPVDLERIIRHISGFQYQVWLFSSTDSAKKQFTHFITNLPYEFYLSLVISLIGIIFSFRVYQRFFVFNIILFLFTIIYSINYDINDIDSYFLLSYFSLSLFSIYGMIWLVKKFAQLKNYQLTLVLSLFPIIQILASLNSVNQNKNFIYEDYTKAILNSLPNNSIVFGYQWDYFVSPSYYFQFVENFRRDVAVIDKELLRRSWYYKQIDTNYPDILDGINTEIKLFLDALKPFERKENYNPNLLESLYRQIMTNLITTNINKRDYHITPEIIENELRRGEFNLPEGYDLVPYLLTYKVVKNSTVYVEAPLPNFSFRIDKIKDKYQDSIIKISSAMLINRALYERIHNKDERAKVYLRKALEINSNAVIPNQLKDLIFN
ncbi:MAG: DUF2723 domain-containing protein [Ignavibacterium sp.]|nr:DUF2723 domain-containing protein [Ignavibacterium sp.]MDW8375420.1 DUF2723 domain-containing protein [Ignavibacteriales bacterium]